MRCRIATRPDFDHPIFRRSTALPPEHCVYVRQVCQRDVGRKGVRGTGEVQMPAIFVNLVMLQPAERLVGGEYHLPTILPVAMIMLLLVRVRTAVVAAALFEESIRYALLRFVLLQMLSDLTRIFQSSAAAVQTAMVVLSARIAGAFRTSRYQIGQLGDGKLLLMLLLIEINRTSASCNSGGGRSGEIYSEIAAALEGILQGIVRRGTPALVGTLTVQTQG